MVDVERLPRGESSKEDFPKDASNEGERQHFLGVDADRVRVVVVHPIKCEVVGE